MPNAHDLCCGELVRRDQTPIDNKNQALRVRNTLELLRSEKRTGSHSKKMLI
jgi:hypothetical protein